MELLKNFYVQRIVKKKITPLLPVNQDSIRTIGLVVDIQEQDRTEEIIQELVEQGFKKNQIYLLQYTKRKKKEQKEIDHLLSLKEVSWKGEIVHAYTNKFVKTPFDLLINYYDMEKMPLLLVTLFSKANFKVGFASVGKEINHLSVDTKPENVRTFVEELVKYLNILNKL